MSQEREQTQWMHCSAQWQRAALDTEDASLLGRGPASETDIVMGSAKRRAPGASVVQPYEPLAPGLKEGEQCGPKRSSHMIPVVVVVVDGARHMVSPTAIRSLQATTRMRSGGGGSGGRVAQAEQGKGAGTQETRTSSPPAGICGLERERERGARETEREKQREDRGLPIIYCKWLVGARSPAAAAAAAAIALLQPCPPLRWHHVDQVAAVGSSLTSWTTRPQSRQTGRQHVEEQQQQQQQQQAKWKPWTMPARPGLRHAGSDKSTTRLALQETGQRRACSEHSAPRRRRTSGIC
ncbi:hypothetical protein CC78DRAFT_575399 [Lojkania enalia]|uniref:Uncharacterized protein n=1 Tax=Lojkania enalia TaxID=147567 RepID=A0A9P4TQ88_9PLEO|nr:hypothetical protein CC78DRAFT_575399 [Didymosphaeria enalia]